MESSGEMVAFPLLMTPFETNYRACTNPYRFPSDNPKKATPTELSWINLFLNSVPSFRKRAESDDTVDDAPTKAEKFAQRYTEILEDFKKDPESHGGPPDCILLCWIREQVLRELGFRDIFKKVTDEENTKAISLFENVVRLNDCIEDEAKRVENLVRGIFAGNIFDLGSAQFQQHIIYLQLFPTFWSLQIYSQKMEYPFLLVEKILLLDPGLLMIWTIL